MRDNGKKQRVLEYTKAQGLVTVASIAEGCDFTIPSTREYVKCLVRTGELLERGENEDRRKLYSIGVRRDVVDKDRIESWNILTNFGH